MKSILKKRQYRKRKEIYQVGLDELKQIMEGCDKLINRIDNKKIKKLSRQKNKINFNYFLFFHK